MSAGCSGWSHPGSRLGEEIWKPTKVRKPEPFAKEWEQKETMGKRYYGQTIFFKQKEKQRCCISFIIKSWKEMKSLYINRLLNRKHNFKTRIASPRHLPDGLHQPASGASATKPSASLVMSADSVNMLCNCHQLWKVHRISDSAVIISWCFLTLPVRIWSLLSTVAQGFLRTFHFLSAGLVCLALDLDIIFNIVI